MNAYWWCPHCMQECDGRTVTYEEYHTCGRRVESVQPGDPLDVLKRENERLRAENEALCEMIRYAVNEGGAMYLPKHRKLVDAALAAGRGNVGTA